MKLWNKGKIWQGSLTGYIYDGAVRRAHMISLSVCQLIITFVLFVIHLTTSFKGAPEGLRGFICWNNPALGQELASATFGSELER